jgi:hypothetical protein
MATAPDTVFGLGGQREELLPLSPFYALNYHFGMLLGVDDFDTEQAYHRAKMRLHNAWLHREGVIWGFDVRLDTERGEIRVLPGLALDAAGHDLHLEADACLNLAAWYEANRDNPDFTFTSNNGTVQFDAHVVIRFKACLTRQVPALMEPCEGGGSATAYSRVFETIDILLRPDSAPDRPLPYHRLRLLFGLDEPIQEDGAVVERDQEVLDERNRIQALAHAAQPQAFLQAFRRFAALDELALQPAMSADGNRTLLFPGRDDEAMVLANLSGITLEAQGDRRVLTGGAVDTSVRPSHVATSTIQELLCSSLFGGSGRTSDARGPRVDPGSLLVDEAAQQIQFTVDRELHTESVAPIAFSVTFFDATGWHENPITTASFEATTRIVTLDLQDPLAGERVRLIARGTGETPLLGIDFVPLAGAISDPPATTHNGRDFVFMHERN